MSYNNPYNEILSWSRELYDWQKDALRRMFEKSSFLSDDDKNEIFDIFINPDKNTHISLTAEHIPEIAQDEKETFKIKSISNIQGINRLSSNETLEFKTDGITVIYGENGSGKTGYSRIIKKLAGQNISILSDVYEAFPPSKSAKIVILKNDKEINIDWKGESNSELKNIAIFDSEIEPEYTKKDGRKIDILPYNLWVFSELSNLCGEFTERIKLQISTLKYENEQLLEKIQFPFSIENPFHKSVNSKTTDQEIETNTNWTDDDKKQLEFLIKNDVLSVLNELEENIPKIQENLKDCKELLLENKILEYNKNCISLQQAKKQQGILADDKFRDEELKGVGKEDWLLMYNAAKEYSEKFAYPTISFPYLESTQNSKIRTKNPLTPQPVILSAAPVHTHQGHTFLPRRPA